MSRSQPNLSADAPWVVMKFGGTSVASVDGWRNIHELAVSRRVAGARVLLVVSALAGITDALKSLCNQASASDRQADARSIAARHHELAVAMDMEMPQDVNGYLQALSVLARAGAGHSDVLLWKAQVQAHGELLSSAMGAAFLHLLDLPATWIDSREFLRAVRVPNQNSRARRLSATLDPQADMALSMRLAGQGEVLIAQGFIARDEQGGCVLLGRGGSDTSATCFGTMLQAERVEIWTDVAGMFSANPRQVPGARLLRRLDYEEAQEIATTGAKVLHPRCLSPLRVPRVPLWIKDSRRPQLEGTVIGPQIREAAPSVKAISSRSGITLISMESVGMWQQVGFLADVFEAFKGHGLSVDLIGSAETNVTVSLDPSENLLDSDAVAALAADLARVCRIKVIAPCAAVTLVGRGMRAMLHQLSSVLAEFGQIRVHMISQSSNNLNLTFVVDEEVVDDLLPRLHELLVRAGSLRSDDTQLFGSTWQALYGGGEQAALPAWWCAEHDSLIQLALQHSPRYVYHLPTLHERIKGLKTLCAVDHFHYSIKANSHARLLETLAESGFGLECVSSGELAAAVRAAPDAALLFTPGFARRQDYAEALRGNATLTLDALHPLKHWGDLFAGQAIMLRVDLGRGLGHHEKVRSAGSSSKFGLPLDQLEAFLELARQHDVRVRGLHAHFGSGILDTAHWGEVYAQLAALAERIGSIEVLNIGGGLGIPSHPGEQALDLVVLGQVLSEVKAAYPHYQLWMEPGRYLVAEAGVLLARVIQIRRKGGQHYLGIDAGMHNLIRPALYEAWHEIVNLSRLGEQAGMLYQVVGPICESGDILGSDRRMPESYEGDVVLIAQAGAYGAVMASNYNLREAADEVVIE